MDNKVLLSKEKFSTHRFCTDPDSTKLKPLDSPDTTGKRKNKGRDFNDWLDRLSQTSDFMQGLHNIVVVKSTRKPLKDTLKIAKSESEFMAYQGKVIRKIWLNKIDVFGPTVYDTVASSGSWLERAGNKLHIKTSDFVIQKNILIKKGDLLDPFTVSDNERVIRALPNIEDARIVIRPVPNSTDSVDVEIITKDLWSLGFEMALQNIAEGNFSLWERNLFGAGYELQNSIYWNSEKAPVMGYDGFYRIRNIAGSFIDGRIYYTSVFENRTYGLNLNRNFFIEKIHYAGGLQIAHLDMLRSIEYSDTLATMDPVRGFTFSCWTGRSFRMRSDNFLTGNRSNIIITGGVNHENYTVRPVVTENFLYTYQNKTLILASIGISEQNFYKSNLIYSFGRTEDIPYGSLMRFTGGVEYNEFFTRAYAAYSLSKGNYLFNWGYLYTNIEFGGFIRDKHLEQGVANIEADFFTNLFVVRRFYFRHFIYFNYMAGIHPFQDEYVSIRDRYGIRGFTDAEVRGDRKAVLRLESVMFTPWYLLNFRIAAYGFADLASIGYGSKFIHDNPLYSGIGAGVRMRNEHLVFNTVQLGLVYYRIAPENGAHVMIQISGERRLEVRNFFVRAPEILHLR